MTDASVDNCVVQIECIGKLKSKELGTGFLVDNNVVATASHVIDGYYDDPENCLIYVIPIKLGISKAIKVKKVLGDSSNNFIVLLELDKNIDIISPLKFTKAFEVETDSEYYAFGHPECQRLYGYPLRNRVTAKITDVQSKKSDWMLSLSGERPENFRGFSGAPVCIDGNLVGIIQTQSDANGKAISLAMSSVNIMEKYIEEKYCVDYVDINGLNGEEFNLEIEIAEISDISKIIKTMINIKNNPNKKINRMKRTYTVIDKIELNNLSKNIGHKIKRHHDDSFDIIEDAISCLADYEKCIRDDLFGFYEEVYIDTLIEFEIEIDDFENIRKNSTMIYRNILERTRKYIFEGVESKIPLDKRLTYISAITAYVFYKCKFLVPFDKDKEGVSDDS
jgi:hypothetical protein